MKNKQFIHLIIITISGIIFLLSSFFLFQTFLEYRRGKKEYEALNTYSSPMVLSSTDTTYDNITFDDSASSDTQEQKKKEAAPLLSIDFSKLKVENQDIVGWIQFPSAAISYPVVQTTDNDFYLTHTFRKEENKVGAIFLDANNSSDLSHSNTFIYGHNMKNGTMFGLLGHYKKQEFYEDNPYFYYYVPGKIFKVQVFSFYPTDIYSGSYQYGFSTPQEYESYLQTITNRSLFSTGYLPSTSQGIITLSTCINLQEEGRFVVHGQICDTFTY